MKSRFPHVSSLWRRFALLALFAALCGSLVAAPAVRVQVNQRGDFTLIGSPFGQEGAANTPLPTAGVVGATGANTADSSPDIFWRSDSPEEGSAEANDTITSAQARTTAVLNLPPGAQVTHAYLYWAATLSAPGSDSEVTLDRPGTSGFSASVISLNTVTGPNNSYRGVADITSLVQANGNGAYRVSDVNIVNWANLNNSNLFGGWWMVVLYRLDSEPLRQLTISDGHDGVSSATPQNITLSGFEVPAGIIDAKLGVVAMEGDNTGVGDSLSFNGTTLSNDQNPANNFFNSSRSYLGAVVSNVGDLPQLTGGPQSMSGIDLDVVDVAPLLTPGQTSVPIAATSAGDVYFLSMFITSVATISPKLQVSGNESNILSGSVTPASENHTDFGSIPVPTGTVTRTFTLQNTGTEDLSITNVVIGGADAADFFMSGAPSTPVAPGASTTLQITFDPSVEGLRSATVTVNSNDIDSPAYTFAVQGTGTLIPDLQVSGNESNIPSGSATPASENHTDFGSALVPSGTVTRTFTLQSSGTKDLSISSVIISGADTDFQVTGAPSSLVAVGASTTLQITFDPTTEGLRSATVTINSDDLDTPAYTFALQGTGTLLPPPSLRGDAVTVGVGGSRVYPLANDGGDDAGSTIASVSNPLVTISADGRSLVIPAGFTGSVDYTTAAGKIGTVTAAGSASTASTRVFSGLLYDAAGDATGWLRLNLTRNGTGTVQLRTTTTTDRALLKLPESVTSANAFTSVGVLTATRNADGTFGIDIGVGVLTGVLRPTPASAVPAKYHVALASTNAAFPGGGFMVLHLNNRGALRISGLMPDGRAFTSASAQADNGSISFFGRQTAGVNPIGVIVGELVPADLPLTDITGEVSWNKPAQSVGSKGTHLGGASATLVANGSLFNGAIPLNGPGVLSLTGGDLASPESDAVTVTGGIPTFPIGSLRAWLGVRPATGRFSPRVAVPGVTRLVTGHGIYLPKSRTGWGYFPGTTTGGRIELVVPVGLD